MIVMYDALNFFGKFSLFRNPLFYILIRYMVSERPDYTQPRFCSNCLTLENNLPEFFFNNLVADTPLNSGISKFFLMQRLLPAY